MMRGTEGLMRLRWMCWAMGGGRNFKVLNICTPTTTPLAQRPPPLDPIRYSEVAKGYVCGGFFTSFFANKVLNGTNKLTTIMS